MDVKYFLISHNEFASGLKKAVEMIVGKQSNLYAFGLMPGNHPDELIKTIEKMIALEEKAVILGDIAGGSVCNSALRLTTNPNVTLITGVNLPLTIEIIASQTYDAKGITQLIEGAREGMKVLQLEAATVENSEDFF